jgi:hypothetical protein
MIKKSNSNNKFMFVIQREHIYDNFQKISAKNILHLYDISNPNDHDYEGPLRTTELNIAELDASGSYSDRTSQ